MLDARFCRAATVALILAAILTSPEALAQDSDGDAAYKSLLEAWKAKEHPKALEQAESFLSAHPGHRHAPAALYMAGNSALLLPDLARAAAFYRKLLADHPGYKMARAARDELVTALARAQDLDACIAQCEANLKQDGEAPQSARWKYTIGNCLYRQWRFSEARKALEDFLAAHAGSPHAKAAREDLSRIEPKLESDASGLVSGYAGKYEKDPRFAAAIAELPQLRQRAFVAIEGRLGLDLENNTRALLRFEDAGTEDRRGLRGTAYTISMGNEPVTMVVFFTEFVVLERLEFRQRFVHEMKHAAFRGAMGRRYVSLPKWVREGLAVYAAGQLEDRMKAILSDTFFGGRDPLSVLDGIAGKTHDTDDYLQDSMAFEWLETARPGAVHAFCRRLVAGEDHEKLFEELSGLEFAKALEAAGAHARRRVEEALGSGAGEFRALRDAAGAAFKKGAAGVGAWLDGGAVASLEGWIEKHPGHVLEPNADYLLGKSLIAAGRHEDGRKRMIRVLQDHAVRCTLCDDAAYQIASSYEAEGKSEAAKAAFEAFTRDYSWSRKARELLKRRAAENPAGKDGGDGEGGDRGAGRGE